MSERKKLKKQLGDKYIFKMYLTVGEVKYFWGKSQN